MEIRTTFAPGDRAHCVIGQEGVRLLKIGQVIVSVTDSPGTEDSLFDNYSPQKSYSEKYMCVETGIGGGNVYTLGETIFLDENDAYDALAKRKADYGQ